MEQAFLDGLKAWFSRYVHSFGGATGSRQPMELKEVHTAYVCRDITILAESECLKGGDIVLAGAIGLLHDVGRFPQYAKYGTFKDSQSENHGELGVRVINEAGILEGLPDDEKAVILESVKFHNAYSVPAMGSRPALFLKL
ncbi:MAG: HD domain-containing protein [Actinomycetota bacterium]|nr:HD domain-containing protein [Actinomycetota bacterium]